MIYTIEKLIYIRGELQNFDFCIYQAYRLWLFQWSQYMFHKLFAPPCVFLCNSRVAH